MITIKRSTLRRLIASTLLAAVVCAQAGAVSVWTEHNDNSRTGQNLAETALTPYNVNANQFGALFHYVLDDQTYSQPLYMPALTMSVDGKAHNVIFVATVNNSVYAYDADSNAANGGNPLWKVNLTPAGARPPTAGDMSAIGACGGGYRDIAGNMGIIGTPVIDQSTGTLYVIARTVEGGTHVQRLHAINITNGAEKFGGPVVISGSVSGVTFNPQINNQRTALALVNGTVYAGWSSHCDNGPYHGFVMGFNASTLARTSIWSSTNSSGGQGGVWQGGQGVTADGANNLYLMTGNGSWDGGGNLGESFVKLSPALGTLDYFTPSNWANLNGGDTDLGAAGVIGIPGTTYVFGGGKQGMVYLVNTANMGHEHATDSVVQEFQATFPTSGASGHIHGGPVYYNNGAAQYVYLWGENDQLRAFQFNGTFNSTAVATSAMKAPTMNTGMPGGFLSVSGNGAANGVVWALTPYNADANQATVQGILHAFIANPMFGQMTEIWNSKQNTARDDFGNFAKFTYPTVANGKVYLSTFGTAASASGQLWVYGKIGANVANLGSGNYTFTPQCSTGSRLDANGQGTGNGTKVQIWQANGAAAQTWTVTNQGNSLLKIQPSYALGLAIDVSGGGTANGTVAQLWADNGSPAQRWIAYNSIFGNYVFTPWCSPSSALDVSGAGTANGTQVQIWQQNGGTAQNWQLTAVGGVPNYVGLHQLTPQAATGSRLDDNAAGTTNGNKVQIWAYNGSAAQQWNFATTGVTPAGNYNLAVNLGPYCLQAGGTVSGTATQLWACNGAAAQSWKIVNGVTAGTAQLQPASAPTLCLNDQGSGTANGTTVTTSTCNNTGAQQWAIN